MNKSRHTDPESFLTELKSIRLSETEKRDMRDRLISYADMHQVPARPIPSPFMSPFMAWRLSGLVAAVVVLMAGGIGVSYAAEDSLPGQPFYTVKVAVIEPIQGALIPTTEGKASWENVLAERRLSEASTLAAQNNLTASTSAYIEQQLALHTTKSEQAADTLAARGNSAGALAVRSDLEARLSAHAMLIATLAPRLAADGDATTTARLAILFQTVSGARAAVQESREATEASLLKATSSSPVRVAIATQAHERQIEESSLFERRAAGIMLMAAPASTTEATTTATTTAATTTDQTATSTPDL